MISGRYLTHHCLHVPHPAIVKRKQSSLALLSPDIFIRHGPVQVAKGFVTQEAALTNQRGKRCQPQLERDCRACKVVPTYLTIRR